MTKPVTLDALLGDFDHSRHTDQGIIAYLGQLPDPAKATLILAHEEAYGIAVELIGEGGVQPYPSQPFKPENNTVYWDSTEKRGLICKAMTGAELRWRYAALGVGVLRNSTAYHTCTGQLLVPFFTDHVWKIDSHVWILRDKQIIPSLISDAPYSHMTDWFDELKILATRWGITV